MRSVKNWSVFLFIALLPFSLEASAFGRADADEDLVVLDSLVSVFKTSSGSMMSTFTKHWNSGASFTLDGIAPRTTEIVPSSGKLTGATVAFRPLVILSQAILEQAESLDSKLDEDLKTRFFVAKSRLNEAGVHIEGKASDANFKKLQVAVRDLTTMIDALVKAVRS